MQISQSNNELCRYNLQVQRSQLTEREREREREVKSSLTQRIHFMETFSNLQIHRI